MIRPPFGRTANSLMPRSISAASRTPIGVASIPIPRRPPGLRRIVRCVRITGITQDRSAGGARRNLPEQLQPFAADVEFKIGEPGCIAARTGEARDKAKLDRIFRNEEGNRGVAALPATAGTLPAAAITLTWRRTRASACSASRSYRPSVRR
jgi:hypothetical protein